MNYLRKITNFLSLNLLEDLENISREDKSHNEKSLEVNIMISIIAILAFLSFLVVLIMCKFWNLETSKVFLHTSIVLFFYFSTYFIKKSKLSDKIKIHTVSIIVTMEYLLLFVLLYNKITVLYWFILLLVIIPLATFSYTVSLRYMGFVVLITSFFSIFLFREFDYILKNNFGVTAYIIFILNLLVIYFVFITFRILLKKSNNRNKKLFELAYKDTLTKIPNREFIHKEITSLIKKKEPFYFVYINIIDFKSINDTINHNVGDGVLIYVSKELKKYKENNSDIVIGRIAGDEFAYIEKKEMTKDEIAKEAYSLLNILRKTVNIDNYHINMDYYCSIAKFPEDVNNYKDLLKAVDLAFYKSKQCGKNKIVFYEKEMGIEALNKKTIEINLKNAIKNNELYIMYQPIINTKNDEVAYFEALLRWKSRDFGSISPAKFIPIAENLGLIHEIGLWVFEKSCYTITKINSEFNSNYCISINVSPLQLKRDDFVDKIKNIIEKVGVDTKHIIIELTESAFIDKNEVNKNSLHGLNELGIKIAIDDFGTGYSSFGYLISLNVDILKIDKVFIDSLLESRTNYQVVDSLVSLGHTIKMKVTAEGVEKIEQVNYLKDLSCDYIQGYYYSKPLLEKDIREYIKK